MLGLGLGLGLGLFRLEVAARPCSGFGVVS